MKSLPGIKNIIWERFVVSLAILMRSNMKVPDLVQIILAVKLLARKLGHKGIISILQRKGCKISFRISISVEVEKFRII